MQPFFYRSRWRRKTETTMEKRVLCYGDSNTWGYIPGSGKRYKRTERWTGICQELLGRDYCILENGINGRTTVYEQEFNRYLNGLSGLGYALLAEAPLDLIVLFLGTNDITMKDIRQVQLGMDELVRICKNADAVYRAESPIFPEGPKILLIAPMSFDPCVDVSCEGSAKGRYRESCLFPEAYRQIAEKYGTEFLDASVLTGVSRADGVHLTPEGHKILGDAVAEKIRSIFEGKS